MPRVKIDYVVSFSSEDPENPASNLLAWDVSKKRWLCAKGEPSCSVVLQLSRAVKISSVQIGAHHAALVEMLVGRSETPNEPFQVLVPSCIFLSPTESRKETGAERVRSFGAGQLSAAAAQRWDRVRLVCLQPYNKHCKYGLNFVHISEPEGASSASAPVPAPLVPVPAPHVPVPAPHVPVPAPHAPVPVPALLDAGSSSDDEFRPGELFAKHRSPAANDTGAQISQATSQALKNISDSATKLVKTPITKHVRRQSPAGETAGTDRRRDGLMYTDDDNKPHAKIDHIVQKHKDEKSKDEVKKTDKKHDRKNSIEYSSKDKKEDSHKASEKDRHRNRNERTPKDDRNRPDPVSRVRKDEPSTSSSRDQNDKERKRPREDERPKKVPLDAILRGVVFSMSGYENPERARLRDAALEMGARYERDWRPHCNFLICAFPNTPKLKQVRASPGGATIPAARGQWLWECRRRRRRLNWRRFASEPAHAQPPGDTTSEGEDEPDDEEYNTDDEIEKVLRKQKKRRTERSPSPSSRDKSSDESSKRDKHGSNVSNTSQDRDANLSNTSQERDANVSNTSDVVFVRDERLQGNVTVHDSDDEKTDEEDGGSPQHVVPAAGLPDLFSGATFALGAAGDHALLARYVAAYGGTLLDTAHLDSNSSVTYLLCTDAASNLVPAAHRVRPDWLWRCHAEKRLYPLQDYLLT